MYNKAREAYSLYASKKRDYNMFVEENEMNNYSDFKQKFDYIKKYHKSEDALAGIMLAFYLICKAADNDYALAQYHLGFFYKNGIGTKVDMDEAVKWFRLSAKNGFAPAAEELGTDFG